MLMESIGYSSLGSYYWLYSGLFARAGFRYPQKFKLMFVINHGSRQ